MPTSRTAQPLSSQVCGLEHLSIERMLSEVAGVVAVSVNPLSEMAYVEYDPNRTNPDSPFAVLRRSGFAPADREAVRRERPTVSGGGPLSIPGRGWIS